MKWNYYSKRRNISLVDFIKNRDIESYEMLQENLQNLGVEAPELGMYQSAYAIAFPPIAKVQKPKSPAKQPTEKPATSKPPAKKRRTRAARNRVSKEK